MFEYFATNSRHPAKHILKDISMFDLAIGKGLSLDSFYFDYDSKKDIIYKSINFCYMVDNHHLYFKPGFYRYHFALSNKRTLLINVKQVNILN